MENHYNSPHKRLSRDRQFKAQLRQVLDALRVKPMTMKELDIYTGIMRESVCWRISELMELGLIVLLRKRRCSVTGYPNVNEYTGDPDLFPRPNQLELFWFRKGRLNKFNKRTHCNSIHNPFSPLV